MTQKHFIRHIIRKQINSLFENVQAAEKLYFKTQLIPPNIQEKILQISNRDWTTKILSDYYYSVTNSKFGKYFTETQLLQDIKKIHYYLLNYHKNVFPVKDFDNINKDNVEAVAYGLEVRAKIIDYINQLPSVAKRNMKADIRKVRDAKELEEYLHNIEYFVTNLSLLNNRSEEIKEKFYKKMFKNNITLNDLMQFVDDKEEFLGGKDFTKQTIKDFIADGEDMDIIYDKNNIMIVEVFSADAIKKIGCNSLWCFTYGSGFAGASREWANYSYEGRVYIIIDFSQPTDSPEFMWTLIKPLTDEENELEDYSEGSEKEDDSPLFNMANENYEDPYFVLKDIFGKNYKEIIYKYLNFDY